MDFQPSQAQKALVASVRALAQRELGGVTAKAGGVRRDILEKLAASGLAGIAMPVSDGGQGGLLLDAVLALEAMTELSPVGGDCVAALNFGAIQQLAYHGSADIKQRFLSSCLTGSRLAAVAMTEPDAGSAVTDLRARARLEGDSVVLNGQKIFTTNAAAADLFVVWARFGDGPRDAGAVVVERDAPGFKVDADHRFMSGEAYGVLYLDNCRVSRSNVLLDGDGFGRLLSVFNVERLGNAARSLACGQAAFTRAVAHARERHQFGRRLAEFQGLQWRFAEMKLKLEQARLLLYRATADCDAGLPSPLEVSLAKLACNRAGFEVANEALQVLGAYGFDDDSELSYLFRRTRGWMIAGGTIEQMLNRAASEIFGENFSQRPSRPIGEPPLE
jgi:alkylation response protein AidB-like acyl-CoA dehydrogenase